MSGAWAAFIPLALLTNTPLPIPFDPVLLAFAAAHPDAAWLFAVVGAGCAAAGAALDALLLPRLGRLLARRARSAGRAWTGRGFYVWAALMAASPLPFYLVRLAVLRARPHPLGFGLAVAAGRLPRYALLLGLLHALRVTPVLAAALAILALAPLTWHAWRRRRAPQPA